MDIEIVNFFFFKQKTAYEMLRSLVGSEMCIRDSLWVIDQDGVVGDGDHGCGACPDRNPMTSRLHRHLSLIHI